MDLVIVGVLGIVGILIIGQMIVIKSEWDKHKQADGSYEFDHSRYEDKINKLGEKAMGLIQNGSVKKQLLPNDASKHDSNMVLKQYIAFIDHSSVYKYLISIKERRYNGKD